MTIKIILSLGLIACCVYFLVGVGSVILLRGPVVLIALVGAYFVWNPDQANVVAQLVGIGRGADLLLYSWVLISIFVIASFHVRQKMMMDSVTRLVRHLALREAAGETSLDPVGSTNGEGDAAD